VVAVGDINGFFGLMFDNLTVLSFLAGILIFAFKFPADIVYTRMFPGYSVRRSLRGCCLHLDGISSRKENRQHQSHRHALGLDTPSTIGIALVVLGPAF